MSDNKQANKLGVRPETRDKLEQIAKERRWTLAETVDVLADFFISKAPKAQVFSGAD